MLLHTKVKFPSKKKNGITNGILSKKRKRYPAK